MGSPKTTKIEFRCEDELLTQLPAEKSPRNRWINTAIRQRLERKKIAGIAGATITDKKIASACENLKKIKNRTGRPRKTPTSATSPSPESQSPPLDTPKSITPP